MYNLQRERPEPILLTARNVPRPEGVAITLTPVQLTLLGVLIVFTVGLVAYRTRVANLLHHFLFAPESALNLALVRIVICGYLLVSINPSQLLRHARFPAGMMVPPVGMQWFVDLVPVTPSTTLLVLVVFYASGLLALLGIYTRLTLPLFVLPAFYVLGVPQLFGKVNHYHHLVWFLALLAASPCSDSLSVDALSEDGRSFTQTERSARYGLPIKIMWLLIAVIYFFPGFWKVWTNGLDWVIGTNLKHTLWHKWYQVGAEPFLRIDHYPLLLGGSALFTVAFELGFVFALFGTWSLAVFVLLGIGFHLATNLIMFIPFYYLLVAYVVFPDWSALLDHTSLSSKISHWARLDRGGFAETSEWDCRFDGSTLPAVITGVLLLVTSVGFGATATTAAWPVASYPTFAYHPEPTIWTLEFDVSTSEGNRTYGSRDLREILHLPPDRSRGIIRNLLNASSPGNFRRRTRAILRALHDAGAMFNLDEPITVYSVNHSVRPDEHGRELARNEVMTLSVPSNDRSGSRSERGSGPGSNGTN